MKETFTRKIGPLPMWAWTSIIGVVIVGWAWWRNRQQSSASSQPSSTADASQVPEFVNQTFTGPYPPSSPPMPGPIGQPGGGSGPPPRTTTSTSGEASAPPGVSRVNRSPQVKHQINQIHKEHQDYEKDKRTGPPARTQVHRSRGRGGPARIRRG